MKDQRELWDNLPQQLVPGAGLCTGRHHGADTSEEAFRTTPEGSRNRQREKVLQYVRRRGLDGATCEEASGALRIPYTAASARITELTRLDLIHDSGRRRPTSHGKTARVHLDGAAPSEVSR